MDSSMSSRARSRSRRSSRDRFVFQESNRQPRNRTMELNVDSNSSNREVPRQRAKLLDNKARRKRSDRTQRSRQERADSSTTVTDSRSRERSRSREPINQRSSSRSRSQSRTKMTCSSYPASSTTSTTESLKIFVRSRLRPHSKSRSHYRSLSSSPSPSRSRRRAQSRSRSRSRSRTRSLETKTNEETYCTCESCDMLGPTNSTRSSSSSVLLMLDSERSSMRDTSMWAFNRDGAPVKVYVAAPKSCLRRTAQRTPWKAPPNRVRFDPLKEVYYYDPVNDKLPSML